MDTIRVILPERSEDAVSEGLRALTETICSQGKILDGGFMGLGGSHGYGEYWDDDIFMMRPYCWCEKDDCPWCAGCDCPEDAYHWFIDGEESSSQEWMDFYKRNVPGVENPKWESIANKITARRHQIHEEICDYCTGNGFFKEHGRESPNFWHKPTDFKVWWYKYIGRSMEIENPQNTDWPEILKDCLSRVAG